MPEADPIGEARPWEAMLLEGNASAHVSLPPTGQPQRRLAVLTCMDARIDPAVVLGLEPGAAQVLRNAGARVSRDVVRSLVLSAESFELSAVAVIHHSDCAVARITNEGLRAALSPRLGAEPDLDFLPIGDPDQAIREDVEEICTDPLLPPGIEVAGFRLDVATGSLHGPLARGVTGSP